MVTARAPRPRGAGTEAHVNDAPSLARLAQSVLLSLVAGLCQIGGGCFLWLSLREERGTALGAIGGLTFLLCGVPPTLQAAGYDFGRVYVTVCAASGGAFLVRSLLGAAESTGTGRTCPRSSGARSAPWEAASSCTGLGHRIASSHPAVGGAARVE